MSSAEVYSVRQKVVPLLFVFVFTIFVFFTIFKVVMEIGFSQGAYHLLIKYFYADGILKTQLGRISIIGYIVIFIIYRKIFFSILILGKITIYDNMIVKIPYMSFLFNEIKLKYEDSIYRYREDSIGSVYLCVIDKKLENENGLSTFLNSRIPISLIGRSKSEIMLREDINNYLMNKMDGSKYKS